MSGTLRFARGMRQNPTPAERMLWQGLRRKSLGLKVRRQVPYGAFILDFYIASARLAIEVDGDTHADSANDLQRDRWLASRGIRVLRFWNNEVTGNLEGVLATILAAAAPPPPDPLPQGEGEQEAPSPCGRGLGEG